MMTKKEIVDLLSELDSDFIDQLVDVITMKSTAISTIFDFFCMYCCM